MSALRPYQQNAVVDVVNQWQTGTRSVCLVAPTGSGKTVMAQEFVQRELEHSGSVLFTVPRRELVKQTHDRFSTTFGRLNVGAIAPGFDYEPYAKVQVATVQTLLARLNKSSPLPIATLVIHDEFHHVVSNQWARVANEYTSARLLGLTATPERMDGKPLGDLADGLTVAAQYSQLLRDGHLVPCRVYQPPEVMGSDLAQDPVQAYKRHGANAQCFAFCASVEAAYTLADRFNAEGIAAACIEHNTPKRERTEHLERFKRGELQVLTNCNTLTEGVDVPAARVCLIARSMSHVSQYLQAAGRVLRPAPGKQDAILIDLVGATLIHGMPTEDRIYSLDGKGIQRTQLAPLKVCPQCAATILAVYPRCPECGWEFKSEEQQKTVRIWDHALREVYSGSATPIEAQHKELNRLLELCDSKGWSIYFAVRQFKDLFGRTPTAELKALPTERKREYFEQLKESMLKKGKTINQVRGMFKATFSHWPDWSWR